MANWGACVVIAGAALTCLTLTQRWGAALPAGLRRGTAWVGGVFGLAHWALYTTYCALRVAGAVGYPGDGDLTGPQMRNFDWANLGYFELWFGIMGVLLIACARRNKALEVPRTGAGPDRRATWPAGRHRAEPDGHRGRRVGRVHASARGSRGLGGPAALHPAWRS